MNSSSSERPVITSGITSGALGMPPNSVRPRKRPKRTMASPARVPSSVAAVAFTSAILRLSRTAGQGVNTEGRREVLELAVEPAETEAFWREFLRSLTRRGSLAFPWSSPPRTRG